MKKGGTAGRGGGATKPPLHGPALGVERYHALVEDALALRKLAPTIELQLDWLLFAHEALLEAEQLQRSVRLELGREVYVRLLQRNLELTESHAAASQDVIDQQRLLMEQTEAAGRDAEAARKLLGCFEDAHQGLIARRDGLRRELAH